LIPADLTSSKNRGYIVYNRVHIILLSFEYVLASTIILYLHIIVRHLDFPQTNDIINNITNFTDSFNSIAFVRDFVTVSGRVWKLAAINIKLSAGS
jgi:hypothetical protein